MSTASQRHTDEPQRSRTAVDKRRATRTRAEPVTGPELPHLDMARVGVAVLVCARFGRSLRPVLSSGAVRVLLALVAATDESGRVSTGAGANVLFDSKTYYLHLAELVAAGHLRKIERSSYTKRHGEVTATGQSTAAKAGRLIERAARELISRSTFAA